MILINLWRPRSGEDITASRDPAPGDMPPWQHGKAASGIILVLLAVTYIGLYLVSTG